MRLESVDEVCGAKLENADAGQRCRNGGGECWAYGMRLEVCDTGRHSGCGGGT